MNSVVQGPVASDLSRESRDCGLMRACVITRYGPARAALELWDDIPVPQPGPRDVLVHNGATSVNPIDARKRSGYGRAVFARGRHPEFPWIIGSDVVGTIVKVGRRVRGFSVGDRVWAAQDASRPGGYAEYVAVDYHHASFRPETLAVDEAAAFPYVACTAWSALAAAGLSEDTTAGKRVLIHAGAGGVGSFAIQLAKAWGAEVATTCSAAKEALVRSLGADHVIDYQTEDFALQLRDYNVVLDTLGCDVPGTEERSLTVLRRDGSYVSIVHPLLPGLDRYGIARGVPWVVTTFLRHKLAAEGRRYHWALFRPDGAALDAVRRLVDEGRVRPVIDREYALEEMADAHAYIEDGHASGKVVVRI